MVRIMNEADILAQIRTLMDSEHELRTKEQGGDESVAPGQLKALEEALDQCWDLLRQRRARQEYRENPEDAAARPIQQVEGYLQ
jgi:hypothetical protein